MRISDWSSDVCSSDLGDFKVELDWDWIHAPSEDALVYKAKAMLGDIGAELVPMELVTPPVPAGRLPEIDSLVRDLVRRGAGGTRAGLLYAFGLHLHPVLGAADQIGSASGRERVCQYV